MSSDERMDEFVRLNVERELLIAQGVDEDVLLKPLYPADVDEE